MSIRIALENPQEFFTNQDIIRGHVLFSLSRAEHVGAIIVKLEGESRTALGMPVDGSGRGISQRPAQAPDVFHNGRRVVEVVHENHKLLYKVAQVFPDEKVPPQVAPLVLAPGHHRFPFEFKFPFNNACSDTAAMSKLGGLAGAGGFASGSGLFGLGGIRVMDGTKQLLYTHVTKTLPPSFTGFPGEAEIRYYVKVTVQRPGLFKENWRYHTGLKFQPIEPPRPAKTNQEAYARRPFVFRARTPRPVLDSRKRTSFFGARHGGSSDSHRSQTPEGNFDTPQTPSAAAGPPSIEVSARLPHPAILTCNKPIPLRIIAKKLVPADASDIFLIALEIVLVGQTHIRCQDLVNTEVTRWVVTSRQGLQIPVSKPGDSVGSELVIPDTLWSTIPLPNTVMPSFVTCNLGREYQLEVKIGLAWGKPIPAGSSFFKGKNRLDSIDIPQEIHLPLNFSNIEIYSGLAPPAKLLDAVRQGRGRRRPDATTNNNNPQRPPRTGTAAAGLSNTSGTHQAPPISPTTTASTQRPPALPPRTSTQPPQEQQQDEQIAPPYDEAPPSYEEAMAEEMTGPMIPPTARPAYSGVTNENSPSTLPEKS